MSQADVSTQHEASRRTVIYAMPRASCVAIRLAFALCRMVSLLARAQDDLEARATWSIPTTADVKARLDDYLATKKLDEDGQAENRSPLAR